MLVLNKIKKVVLIRLFSFIMNDDDGCITIRKRKGDNIALLLMNA